MNERTFGNFDFDIIETVWVNVLIGQAWRRDTLVYKGVKTHYCCRLAKCKMSLDTSKVQLNSNMIQQDYSETHLTHGHNNIELVLAFR